MLSFIYREVTQSAGAGRSLTLHQYDSVFYRIRAERAFEHADPFWQLMKQQLIDEDRSCETTADPTIVPVAITSSEPPSSPPRLVVDRRVSPKLISVILECLAGSSASEGPARAAAELAWMCARERQFEVDSRCFTAVMRGYVAVDDIDATCTFFQAMPVKDADARSLMSQALLAANRHEEARAVLNEQLS